MHHPVLLNTVIKYLNIKKNGRYIDATAGEGNYIKEILNHGGLVLAIDWDCKQIKKLQNFFKDNPHLVLVNDNFSKIREIALNFNFYPADGIIFDLGLSMDQLQQGKRGFSYKNLHEKLDMRINHQLSLSAIDILNHTSEKELKDIFFRYGEEVNGQIIAQAIVNTKKKKKIKTVGQLIKIIDQTLKKKDEDTYRRIFQALRIKVNHELENLENGLKGALSILHPHGRILVISFHSLESRLIKQFIKKHQLKMITKKVIKGEHSSQLRVFGLNI